jgi:hypothetical protein
MSERGSHKRALAFALLGTLIIRLLAWAPWGEVTVHADRVCQTVPTPTPSLRPGVVPTEPSRPTRTPRVSPVPTVPTELPYPPGATSQPATGTPAAIATTGIPTTEPTVTVSSATEPAGVSPTPMITEAAPSVTPTTALNPAPVGTYPPTAPVQLPSPLSTADVSSATGSGVLLLSAPCLWNVLGLLLVAGGIVVLVRRRRPS